MKKISYFTILFLINLLLPCCRDKQDTYPAIDLLEYYPYMVVGYEENIIDLDQPRENTGYRDVTYMLSGFRRARKTSPKTQAFGKVSTIGIFLSELEDKKLVLDYRPPHPSAPPPTAEITLNGKPLETVRFDKPGNYRFDIAASRWVYGSNYLDFHWQWAGGLGRHAPAGDKGHELGAGEARGIATHSSKEQRSKTIAGFSSITLKGKLSRKKKSSRVELDKKSASIMIPPGGVLEYFVIVPSQSILSFTPALAVSAPQKSGPGLHAAVTNAAGKSLTYHFNPGDLAAGRKQEIELADFAGETVKIVFANSTGNHPNCDILLGSPAIYTKSPQPVTTGQTAAAAARQDMQSQQAPSPAVQARAMHSRPAPHVFIYLIDTLRADHLGCYGYSLATTPYIDAFAGDGVIFTRCFANAPWTRPAVASILSGLYAHKHRAEDRSDVCPGDVQLLPGILKDHGYTTVYLTANGNVSKEMNFARGSDMYKLITGKKKEDDYRSSEVLCRELSEIFKGNPRLLEKPLFVYLHAIDPHYPYTPQEPFLTFKKKDPDRDRQGLGYPANILKKKQATGLDARDIEYMQSLYDCEILQNDYYFGQFTALLKEQGIYDEALIILLSDHGEQFDEHGEVFHGRSIYNEEIHIPLIIKFPKSDPRFSREIPPRVEQVTGQVDVMPTILEVAGIKMPSRLQVDGRSLLTTLADAAAPGAIPGRAMFSRISFEGRYKAGILAFHPPKNGSARGDKKEAGSILESIATYEDGSFTQVKRLELYDWGVDRVEKNNLLSALDYFRIGGLKFAIDSIVKDTRLFGVDGKKLDLETLDPAVLDHLKALGYLE